MSTKTTTATNKIAVPQLLLRGKQATEKDQQKWNDFCLSLRAGQLQPITVIRPDKGYSFVNSDSETIVCDGNTLVLTDGYQRYCAMDEMGLPVWYEILPNVKTVEKALQYAITANLNRWKQRNGDIAKVVRAWASAGESVETIAQRLHFSNSKRVFDFLSMSTLDSTLLEKINTGVISLQNGIALSKVLRKCVTEGEKERAIHNAESLKTTEFEEFCVSIADLRRKEKQSITAIAETVFKPVPVFDALRLENIRTEYEIRIESVELDNNPLSEYEKGQYDLIQYVYTMSPEDIAEQLEVFNTQKAELLEKAKKREDSKKKK